MLYLLPEWKQAGGGMRGGDFPSRETIVLNDANLVDLLTRLELTQDIRRVNWRHSILAIDLAIPEEAAESDEIYDDLYEICALAFEHTSNVTEVLVRVLDDGRMLLSMDAARANWEAGGMPNPSSHR